MAGCPAPPPGDRIDNEQDLCVEANDPEVTPAVVPEIDGQLTINEFMAKNVFTLRDEKDAPGDWVELYNPTEHTIPLKGYALTNDLSVPRKAVIRHDLDIPARGYLLLWLGATADRGAAHLCIQLPRDGGAIGLARPDGSYIDRVEYGRQETDFSAARTPDGSDHWRIEWHPSPAAANRGGPGQPVGLEDEALMPEQAPDAGDMTEVALGYDELFRLEIIVPPAGIAKLDADPYEYVEGDIVWDGRRIGPVGVRLKGNQTLRSFHEKPSFRIKVDKYAPDGRLLGLGDLTLNNMSSDFSMMHERLAYLLAREANLPASRSNHAIVTVNGQHYGLYAHIEAVKRQMLRRWFADDTGALFEAVDVDFEREHISRYEHKLGPNDRRLLAGLAAALEQSTPDAALAAAAQYVDLDHFRRFWALCALVGQYDSFPYSMPGDDIYLYADPTTNKLWFVPWGMDETFYSADYDVMQVYSVLATTCLASPACKQELVNEMWELLAMAEDMDWVGELNRVAEQIAPHVTMDTMKEYDDAMVAEFQQQLYWFLSGRRIKFMEMLPPATR